MDNPNDVAFNFKLFKKSPELTANDLIEIIKQKQTFDISVQILNPSWIVSERHLQIAVYHTLQAFNHKTNIAKGRETELLIRISGFRQIKNAAKDFGIDDKLETLLLVAFGGTFKENELKVQQILSEAGLLQIENVSLPITADVDLCKYYGIDDKSKLLEKEVIEKMATVEIT
ncbi:MAG: hypothetical protein KGD64_05190 [Candidatus Heimdallarchaeota archaeon]|nr:hypothetical protein [Candidatus Heimdallarchaeota archaeon]